MLTIVVWIIMKLIIIQNKIKIKIFRNLKINLIKYLMKLVKLLVKLIIIFQRINKKK